MDVNDYEDFKAQYFRMIRETQQNVCQEIDTKAKAMYALFESKLFATLASQQLVTTSIGHVSASAPSNGASLLMTSQAPYAPAQPNQTFYIQPNPMQFASRPIAPVANQLSFPYIVPNQMPYNHALPIVLDVHNVNPMPSHVVNHSPSNVFVSQSPASYLRQSPLPSQPHSTNMVPNEPKRSKQSVLKCNSSQGNVHSNKASNNYKLVTLSPILPSPVSTEFSTNSHDHPLLRETDNRSQSFNSSILRNIQETPPEKRNEGELDGSTEAESDNEPQGDLEIVCDTSKENNQDEHTDKPIEPKKPRMDSNDTVLNSQVDVQSTNAKPDHMFLNPSPLFVGDMWRSKKSCQLNKSAPQNNLDDIIIQNIDMEFLCNYEGCHQKFKRNRNYKNHKLRCPFRPENNGEQQNNKRTIESQSTSSNASSKQILNQTDTALPLSTTINSGTQTTNKCHTATSDQNVSKNFVCGISKCGLSYQTQKQLTIHKQLQHKTELQVEPIRFTCPNTDCNRWFSTQDKLDNHLEHHQQWPYRCKWNDCTFGSFYHQVVLRHVRTAHLGFQKEDKDINDRLLDNYVELIHPLQLDLIEKSIF